MSKLGDAKSLADSYLDEISATLEIRQTYNSIVIAHAGILFAALQDNRPAKEALQAALKHKTVDTNPLYRSLIVQINGVFENYIRSLVKYVVEERFEAVETYSQLKRTFRNDHIAHTAKIISLIKSGTIMGMPYNFDILLTDFGKSLSDQKGFKLHSEVYTQLMGNCTSSRLDSLFEALELKAPFSESLGKNSQLKAYFSDKAKGRVADRARETLDNQIDLRNYIVHGDLTRSVDLNDLNESIKFFRSLISALNELVDP
jgi:hypothetical protein